MHTLTRIGVCLLASCLAASAAAAAVILVPEQFPTIQSGLNAANSGDTVSVAPGLYFGSVSVNSDGIKLLSRVRHAATIDGGGNGHVVTCNNVTCVIEGFTLTNAGVTNAAVFTSQKSQIIRDNLIVGNNGHGIVISSGASVLIERNSITDNGSLRAGIKVLTGAVAEILNNYIARNGSGINRLPVGDGSYLHVEHNTIVDNASFGISLGGRATIEHNIIVGSDYGIYFVDEYAADLEAFVAERLSLSYNDVWGHAEFDYFAVLSNTINWTDGEFTPTPGVGEISVDPMLLGVELMAGSPCIDAGGDPQDFTGVPCVDIDGKARIIDGDGSGAVRADIGAFEFAPAPTGLHEVDGLRWESATQLEWDPAGAASAYSVYRGAISAVGYNAWGDCLTTVPTTSLVELQNPVVDSGFFYLVTAVDAGDIEGPMGGASCVVRANAAPCAGP